MKEILGYSNRLTVRPGETIDFKISAKEGATYRAQLVRVINGDSHSSVAGFREVEIDSPINASYVARHQPIPLGSYVLIENVAPLQELKAFTVAVACMPTAPNLGRQHLICRWDEVTGIGWCLHIDEQGRLAFASADRRGRIRSVHIAQRLSAKRWYCAVARVSWAERSLNLDCLPLTAAVWCPADPIRRASGTLDENQPQVSAPLLIAAAFGGRTGGGHYVPAGNFNGRLEAPVIYDGLLTDIELSRVAKGERPAALRQRLVADWDFGADISSTHVRDRSRNGLHGRTYNLPLRGLKGSHWDGSEMNWRHAPDQYGAIHFHADDLHDCGWETDIRYTVPANMRSGVYAVRIRLAETAARTVEEGHEDYLPFFVAAPNSAPQSHLALVLPTYTYLAYANVRVWDSRRVESGLSREDYFAPAWSGPGTAAYSIILSEHPELGSSTYDRHLDGSPVHISSWLRPLLNMRPKSVLWTLCADLLLVDWLEARGVACDILTDDLLDQEGAPLLQQYRVVMTGNHPEYQTTALRDAFECYLAQGGRLVYMGGNGFYSRCATHPSVHGAIEVRRGRTGSMIWMSDVGEEHFAFTAERGGIWRELGRPPQQLLGVGFIAEGKDSGRFRILAQARRGRAAFALQGIESDVIGLCGVFGGAVGQEIDRTNADHGTPPHTVVLARSEGHTSAMIYVIEEMNPVDPVVEKYLAQTYAEVVFFETASGGAVFSVGSMAWCGCLSHHEHDNDISTMTANVLRRMLDSTPFELPIEPIDR
jgi:N,N-dimethylformamidase